MDITKEIKKLIIDENITVKELADRLGVSPTSVSNKFSRNNMKIGDIEKFAKVLGYRVEVKFIKENAKNE